jgi:GDPmannose 4,6-dehydratase
MYRRTGAVFCAAGILYNHESPRRKLPFVSRKIVQAAVDIKMGVRRTLTLGNLAAAVDWGAAEDYTEAMTRILRLDSPRDFVVASGRLHTVREFVEAAFSAVDLAWEEHVVEDGSILRGVQRPVPLLGDASCLRDATGWRPLLDFTDMVRRMVSAEMKTRAAR